MNPIDLIVFALIAAIVGLGIGYIYKSKKRGVKCIGCPEGAKCSDSCAGCPGSCGGSDHMI